jgi:lysophospholipase L1-like esterase
VRRLSLVVLTATLIVPILQMPAARAGGDETVFYLALGDSLAAGFQPNGATHEGYVDDLWQSLSQQIPGLELENVGCSGETSRSLISGKDSPCEYPAGSQLDQAVAFLEAHPGQIAFMTIDVGANDLVNRCLDFATGLFDNACAVKLLPGLERRVARTVDALGAAAADVPIVGMSYYDPFLGLWLVPGGHKLARVSLKAVTTINGGLETAYSGAGANVADVAVTFNIDDFAHTVVVSGLGTVPVNVAIACTWTWFCSEEFFGDVHANATGYRKIANTFEQELAGLLP